ncbi:MarR family winged helix-turn-helix transcriptional regulator [Streptomyces sp. NPDC059166]|uniref:MarR family winged helix-turn-helix transcriptional regulator n=1 Tax=Streptomyces sp. NPDC059166 TaxID=3346752 RepID=UPI0036BD02EF
MQQPTPPGTADAPCSVTGTPPPSVLGLNTYLMYATGKAARRRLTDALAAHGLRLWHLTILAMLDEAGRLSKGDLATRLDMNQSDLTRTVTDLDAAGYVECARDASDRRRIEVALTPAGRAALTRLQADVTGTETELLAALDHEERERFTDLLRRVHGRLEEGRAGGSAARAGQEPAVGRP